MARGLAIVGAGRVGRALGRYLRELGWRIGAVVTKSEPNARRAVLTIGAGRPCVGLSRRILESDVILIATPEEAIAVVAKELARIGAEELDKKVVLHTSGVLDVSVLDPLREHGAAVGTFHPLQSFTGVGIPTLDGRVFAIDGDPAALRVSRQIARSLGGSPILVTGEDRALFHAATAMAAGHVLAVEEAATRMLMSFGMKRREAARALLPLTRQVLENYELLGLRAAGSGSPVRGDGAVVAAHLAAMQQLPSEFSQAYEALNRLLVRALEPSSLETLEPLETMDEDQKSDAKGTGG